MSLLMCNAVEDLLSVSISICAVLYFYSTTFFEQMNLLSYFQKELRESSELYDS